MIVDLAPASRREHLVFFDSDAIPPDTKIDPDLEEQDPKPPPQDTIRSLAANGQALVIKIPGEDCEASVRLHVNEEPAEAVRSRGICKLKRAALKLPSGTLKADGLEFITRPGEERMHSEAESVAVEPGVYDVEVWDLFSWKTKNVATYVNSRTTRWDRAVGRMVAAYTWLGILLFPANLLLAPLAILITSERRGWGPALALFGLILAIDALVLAGFWLLDWASTRVRAPNRVSDLRREFESENPDIALVLRQRSSVEDLGKPAMVVLSWS